LNAAKQRLEGIQALAEIGERASVDTVEAAILYQTRLLDLQNALMDGQKNTNGLSVFIWQNDLPLGVGITYQSTDSLDVYYNKATSALLEHLAQNEIQNPIISKYNAYQKVLDTELRLKKEMIKPILNVKYNFLAKNSSAINSMFSDNNYKWGVNMSFPLLLRNPTNEYKMAKINSENNTLELSNKTNELNFKVNALKQNISILAQQLLNAEQSVKYSKLLLEAERLKFQNGESSVFMINNRENKVLDTELKLAEYKLKFIKTVLQVIYLNGNLSYRL
ncbi:MAG: TolC family protein, partial [Bacteroidia bacterium]|nr:TolC family protein [Bacteroidia bacterium]